MADILPIANLLSSATIVNAKNPGAEAESSPEGMTAEGTQPGAAFSPILQTIIASLDDVLQQPATLLPSETAIQDLPVLSTTEEHDQEADPAAELQKVMASGSLVNMPGLAVIAPRPQQVVVQEAATASEENTHPPVLAIENNQTGQSKATVVVSQPEPTQVQSTKKNESAVTVAPPQLNVYEAQPSLQQHEKTVPPAADSSVVTETNGIQHEPTGLPLGQGWVAAEPEEVADADLVNLVSTLPGQKEKSKPVDAGSDSERILPTEIPAAPGTKEQPAGGREARSEKQPISDVFRSVTFLTSSGKENSGIQKAVADTSDSKKFSQVFAGAPAAMSTPDAEAGPLRTDPPVMVPAEMTAALETGTKDPATPAKIQFVPALTLKTFENRADEVTVSKHIDATNLVSTKESAVPAPNSSAPSLAQDRKDDGRPDTSQPSRSAVPEVTQKKNTFEATKTSHAASETELPAKEKSEDAGTSSPAGTSVKLQQPGNLASVKEAITAAVHTNNKIPGLSGAKAENAEAAQARHIMLPPDVLTSVHDQIAKAVSLKLMENASEMKIILKPESLGEVAINVRMEEGTMAARIDVSQPQVRAALEANLPQLREALTGKGIQVERIDILNTSFSSSKESNTPARERGKSGLKRGGETEGVEAYESVRYLGYNTLDYLV